mmetsp:Transcript_13464/g.27496  ORF Transcript_13464/g.27496 Transcript_13464/m.27496 type:complete len:641 (-) Transcript_13464:1353-3275(-)
MICESILKDSATRTFNNLIGSMASAVTDDGVERNGNSRTEIRTNASTIEETSNGRGRRTSSRRKSGTMVISESGGAAFVDVSSSSCVKEENSNPRERDLAERRRQLLERLNQIDVERARLERLRWDEHGREGVESEENALLQPSIRASDGNVNGNIELSGSSEGRSNSNEAGIHTRTALKIEDADHDRSIGERVLQSTHPTPASPASLSSPAARSARVRTPSVLLASQPGESLTLGGPSSTTKEFIYCDRLIRDFMKLKEANPFSAPIVELWSEESIPNYFDIVEKPMDLRTVSRKLDAGEYNSSRVDQVTKEEVHFFDTELFAADVRLTFRNAMLYNRVGDHFYELARSLLERFDKKFALLPVGDETTPVKKPSSNTLKRKKSLSGKGEAKSTSNNRKKRKGISRRSSREGKLEDTKPKTPRKSKQEVRRNKLLKRRKEEENMNLDQLKKRLHELKREKILVEVRSSPAGSPRYGSVGTPPAALLNLEMTYEEKRSLGEAINNLPYERLGRLLQIIAKRSGQAETNWNEEIEIDIDAMDNVTLRELEAYVNSVGGKKKTKKSSASIPFLNEEITRVEDLIQRKEFATMAETELEVREAEKKETIVETKEKSALSDSESSSSGSSGSDSDSSDDSDSSEH